MPPTVFRAAVVIAATFLLHGCRDISQPSENVAPPSQATQQITSVPSTRPIVEMWNGGIHLAGIKPFLLFAAWEDGTVLARRSFEPCSLRQMEVLLIGKARQQDIEHLLKTAEDAGFFAPPIRGPVVYPDGPDFIISINHGGKGGMLEYHGGDPKLDQIGPNASPSRSQVQAFHELWRKVVASIRDCPVSGLSEFRGEAPLSMISRVRKAPASPPAPRPAATSQPVRVTVKETRKQEDTASAAQEDGVMVVVITSRSGIGSMTLVSQGRDWPAKVRVRLQYEDGRPFRSLEMFGAALGRGAGKDAQKVDHRIVKSPRGVSVELSLPEGEGLRELKLSWIDAYRQ